MILTFGASHIWHETYPECLVDCILPKFRKLAWQGQLSTGDLGKVAARLIFLLAMDTCKNAVTPEDKSRVHTGESYSVATFLRVLQGPSVEFQDYNHAMMDDD